MTTPPRKTHSIKRLRKKRSQLKRDQHVIAKLLNDGLISSVDNQKVQKTSDTVEEENYKEKYVRLLAEFENYRRRTSREKDDLLKYSLEEFIKELIPVIDDLDRTLQSISPKNKKDPILEGIHIVRENFTRILKKNGIESFISVGELFDPHLHDALMSQTSDEFKSQTVLQEFEKGYKYHDRVIRHAKVIVAK